MKTRCPSPFSASFGRDRPGHQDRRLEVDPERPLHLLRAEVLQLPGRGQRGIGDQPVEVAGLARPASRRPRARPGRRRSLGAAPPRPAASRRACSSSSPFRELSTSLAPWPASSLGDRATDSPGGAAEQHPLPLEIHARTYLTRLQPTTFVNARSQKPRALLRSFRRRNPVPRRKGTGGGILLPRMSRRSRRLGLAALLFIAALVAAAPAAGQTGDAPRRSFRVRRRARAAPPTTLRPSCRAARRASPPALRIRSRARSRPPTASTAGPTSGAAAIAASRRRAMTARARSAMSCMPRGFSARPWSQGSSLSGGPRPGQLDHRLREQDPHLHGDRGPSLRHLAPRREGRPGPRPALALHATDRLRLRRPALEGL